MATTQKWSWTGPVFQKDDVKYVHLHKDVHIDLEGQSLGLQISGGTDDKVRPDDDGVFVSDVIEGCAANKEGTIQPGDKLCSVNGTSLQGMPHDDYVTIIKSAVVGQHVHIVISRRVRLEDADAEAQFNGRHGFKRDNGLSEPGYLQEDPNRVVLASIRRRKGSFGLALCGDMEETGKGIFIGAVFVGSMAAETSLRPGMQILAINGWNVTHATLEDVQQMIVTHDGLQIAAVPNPDGFVEYSSQCTTTPTEVDGGSSPGELRSVRIHRIENAPFGMKICGPPDEEVDFDASGIYVSEVAANSLAGSSGIQAGDELLEINGLSLRRATHSDAARALAAAGSQVTLIVAHNPNAMEKLHSAAEALGDATAPETEKKDDVETKEYEASESVGSTQTVTLKPVQSVDVGLRLASIKTTRGDIVVIAGTVPGSVADEAKERLRVGNQVTAINGADAAAFRDDPSKALEASSESLELVVTTEPRVAPAQVILALSESASSEAVSSKLELVHLPDNVNGIGFRVIGYAGEQPAPAGVFARDVDGAMPKTLNAGSRIVEIFVDNVWESVAYSTVSDVQQRLLLARSSGKAAAIAVARDEQAFNLFCASRDVSNAFDTVYSSTEGKEVQDAEAEVAGHSGDVVTTTEPVAAEPKDSGVGEPSAAESEQDLAQEQRVDTTQDDATTAQGVAASAAPVNSAKETFFVMPLFDWAAQNNEQLSFKAREVLRVYSTSDPKWWKASSAGADEPSGVIPSPAEYERHYKTTDAWKRQTDLADQVAASMQKRNKAAADDARREALTVHSYVRVERRSSEGTLRPLAIYGAAADKLLVKVASRLRQMGFKIAQPLRCTSRPMRDTEKDGREYEFVSMEAMQKRLDENELIEVGRFNNNLYGTSLSAVTKPVSDGKFVMLNVQPSAVRRLLLQSNARPVVALVLPETEKDAEAALSGDSNLHPKTEYAAAQSVSFQFGDIITNVVPLGDDFGKIVDVVADLAKEECTASEYWAISTEVMPATGGSNSGERAAGSNAMNSQPAAQKSQRPRVVVLGKSSSTGGFNVSLSRVSEDALPSVSISGELKHLKPGGYLTNGECVLAVNGQDVSLATQEQVSEMLEDSKDRVELLIVPALPGFRVVSMKRGSLGSLFGPGFGVEVEAASSREKKQGYVRVASLKRRGSVAKQGLLHPGEAIIAVNGKPMEGAKPSEVDHLLKSSRHVALVVAETSEAKTSDDGYPGTQVTLRRGDKGFGFKLAVAPRSTYPSIAQVAPGGAADESGKLQEGDFITSVNGQGLANKPQEEVINAIANAGDVLNLTVLSPPSGAESAATRTVFVRRRKSLGIKLVVNEQPKASDVPMILELIPDTPAAECGELSPGDAILQINGKSTKGMTMDNAVDELKRSEEVMLVVASSSSAEREPEMRDVAAAAKAPEPDEAAMAQESFYDVRTVTLKPEGQGLGLRFITVEKSPYALVSDVVPGSVADKCGQFRANDVILEINGKIMKDKSHDERIAAFKERDVEVVVKVAAVRKAASHEPRTFTLAKTEKGYGMKILTASPPGDNYPVVSDVVPGAAADLCGQVHPGDLIVQIGDVNMKGKDDTKVVEMLRKSETVILTVKTPTEPSKVFLEHQAQASEVSSSQDSAKKATKEDLSAGPQVKVVTLVRGERGLGIKIATGAEEYPRVAEIVAGGVAEKEGTLKAGAEIIKVNNEPMNKRNHDEIVKALSASKRTVIVARIPQEAGASTNAQESSFSSEPSFVTRNVKLEKGPTGLGLKVSTPAEAAKGDLPVVTDVIAGGVGESSGMIFAGDMILSINGETVDGVSHDQVIKKLASSKVVDLVLRSTVTTLPDQQPSDKRPVERVSLHLGAGELLGLQLATSPDQAGHTVHAVVPGYAAAKSGKVSPGDEILEINGQNVSGLDHDKVIELVKGKSEITLVLAKSAPADQPIQQALGSEARTVELQVPSGTPLGMKIGTDEGTGAHYVEELIPGTVAADCGKIFAKDILEQVNGINVHGMSHPDLINLIKKSETVQVVVRQPASDAIPVQTHDQPQVEEKQSEDSRTIHLKRQGKPLGLKISTVDNELVTVILQVLPDGAAAANGQLKRGDQFVSINGKSAEGCDHDAFLSILRSAGDELEVVVKDSPLDVNVLEQQNEEQLKLSQPAQDQKAEDAQSQPADASSETETMEAPKRQGSHTEIELSVERKEGDSFGMAVISGETDGLKVGEMDQSKLGYKAGIRRGDIIIEVNGVDLRPLSHDDALKHLAGTGELKMKVLRAVQEIDLTPGDSEA